MSIRFVQQPELANVITHGGNFHADDIFSLVLLEKVFGDLTVFRIANINSEYSLTTINPDVLVIDIGYGEFDHHQKGGNGCHPTAESNACKKAIPYATFGILWKKFGKSLCDSFTTSSEVSEKLWEAFEEHLVIGIDATDNGIYPHSPEEYSKYRILTISNVITLCNPLNSIEEKRIDVYLNMAIEFARFVFDKTIENQLFSIMNVSNSQPCNRIFKAEQIFTEAFIDMLPDLQSCNDFANELLYSSNETEYHPKRNSLIELSKLSIPFSSFGKIWNMHGRKLCNQFYKNMELPDYIWDYIRVSLISGIDAMANGILPLNSEEYVKYDLLCMYDFIESLNPHDFTEESYIDSKNQAIALAKLVIDRFLLKSIARIRSKTYVERRIEQTLTIPNKDRDLTTPSKHILVLDEHVHWQEWLVNSTCKEAKKIWFVISPSNKGGYIIHPVPNKYNPNGYRKGFPKKWWGLNGKQLQKVTKNPSASFVHESNGFIAGAETLQGAVALCKRAFSHRECERPSALR